MTQTATFLTEDLAFDSPRDRVDRKNFVIPGVAVLQAKSRNNRIYTEDVLRKAATVFEEVPVTIRGGHNRADRDYHSQNGVIRNGVYEEATGITRYDWHLNEDDPLTLKIMRDAEKFPSNLPLSVEIGEWTQEEDKASKGSVRITDITDDSRLLGLATVYKGGTNNGAFEDDAEALGKPKELKPMKTVAELRTAYPELVKELVECECETLRTANREAKERLAELAKEREELNSRLAEVDKELDVFKTAQIQEARKIEITEFVRKELGDPAYVVEEKLMGTLLYLYEDEQYKPTVEIMKQAYTKTKGEKPTEEIVEGEKPESRSGLDGASDKSKPKRRPVLLDSQLR